MTNNHSVLTKRPSPSEPSAGTSNKKSAFGSMNILPPTSPHTAGGTPPSAKACGTPPPTKAVGTPPPAVGGKSRPLPSKVALVLVNTPPPGASKPASLASPSNSLNVAVAVTPPVGDARERTCAHAGCGQKLFKQPLSSAGLPLSPSQRLRRLLIIDQDKRSLQCSECARPCYARMSSAPPKAFLGKCEDCGGRDTKYRPSEFRTVGDKDRELMKAIDGGGWTERCMRWGCGEHGRNANGRPWWE